MNAHSSERSSLLTRRWREPDSNHQFREGAVGAFANFPGAVAALRPANPIKCHVSTKTTQTPDSADMHYRAAALDPIRERYF